MNKFKVVGLRALVRFLAIVIFLLTSVSSCGIVYVASSAVFYPEQTEFPNGVPPAPFAVVIENRAAAGRDDAFGVIRWEKAAAMVAKDGPGGFRLSVKEFRSQGGDLFNFDVLEETPTSQVVQMTHANTGTIKTRYRIEGNRITPLSYKSDGGVGLVMLLTPAFVICLWLGLVAARRSTAWLNGVLQIEPAVGSQGMTPAQAPQKKSARGRWLIYIVTFLALSAYLYWNMLGAAR